MKIADAQVHIWGPDKSDRPWPEVTHSDAHRHMLLGTGDRAWVMGKGKGPCAWLGWPA